MQHEAINSSYKRKETEHSQEIISVEIKIGKGGLKITKKLPLLEIKNDEQMLRWVEKFNLISILAKWSEEERREVIKAIADGNATKIIKTSLTVKEF